MGRARFRALAIDPINPATVYAGHYPDYGWVPPIENGMSRSNDYGDSWAELDLGRVEVIVIDPTTPSTLYAGGISALSRSLDSGDTWEALSEGLPFDLYPFRALAVDAKTPSTLYAGFSGGGVFRSIDSGETWKAMSDGLNNLSVYALVVTPTTPSTVYAGTYGNGVFVYSPAPLGITGLTPAIASSGTRITVSGTGFSWGEVDVFFNGVSGLDIEVVDDGTLGVTIPELPLGPAQITVTADTGSATLPGGPDGLTISDIVESSFYFPQFADGRVGNLRFQSRIMLANTDTDSWVRVEFYRSPDGEPMTITLDELGTDSTFEFPLRELESVSLSTTGSGELQVGYARVTASEAVGGVVIFQRTDLPTGISLYEAGVPASKQLSRFSLFVDSLGVRDTGVAIVHPPHAEGTTQQAGDAQITIRLYDKQSNLVGQKTLDPLSPRHHLARYVHEMFDDLEVKGRAREMVGILVVDSDQPLVAVTLSQNDDPAKEFPQEVPILTTVPVMPIALDEPLGLP